MGSRRQAREATLQMLYLCDNCRFSPGELGDTFYKSLGLHDGSLEFSRRLFGGTWGKRDVLDELISRYTENWDLARMAVVDRNILRLATYEILDMPETPISVVIDEAVEIAKKYSTADSGKFVNGILDKMKSVREKSRT